MWDNSSSDSTNSRVGKLVFALLRLHNTIVEKHVAVVLVDDESGMQGALRNLSRCQTSQN